MKPALIVGTVALLASAGGARAQPSDPTVGLFVQNVAVSNAFERAEATIMLEDGTDPTLRSFARQMAKDHAEGQRALRWASRRAGVPTSFILDAVSQKKVDDIGLLDGAKLDAAYVADQVEVHAAAAASLQAYAAHGSDVALVAYARQTLPVVLMHQRILEEITGHPKPM